MMSHIAMVGEASMNLENLNVIILAQDRDKAIMLVKLSFILFSNYNNFIYYAHRFYLLFLKLCLIYCLWHFRQQIICY